MTELTSLIFLRNDPLDLERTLNHVLYGPEGLLRSTFVDSSSISNGDERDGAHSSTDDYVPQVPVARKSEGVNRDNDVLKGFIPGNNSPAVSSEEGSDYKQRSFSTGAWTGSRVERLHAGTSSSKQGDELFSPDDLNKNLGLDGQTEKTSAWDVVAKNAEPNYQAFESSGDGSFHHYSPMDFFSDPEEEEATYNQDETIDGVAPGFANANATNEHEPQEETRFEHDEVSNDFVYQTDAEEPLPQEEKWGNDWQAEEPVAYEADSETVSVTSDEDEFENLEQRLEDQYGGLAPLPEKVLSSTAQERRVDGDLVFEPLPAELASYFDEPTDLDHGLPSQVDQAILAEMERERNERVHTEVQQRDRRTLSPASLEPDSGIAPGLENSTNNGRSVSSAIFGARNSFTDATSGTANQQMPHASAGDEASFSGSSLQAPVKKNLLEKLFGWLPFFKKEQKLDASDIRALSRRKSQPDSTSANQSPENNWQAPNNSPVSMDQRNEKPPSSREVSVFPASPMPQAQREFNPPAQEEDVSTAPVPKMTPAEAFSPVVPQAREQFIDSIEEIDDAIDPEIAKLAASISDDGNHIETEPVTTILSSDDASEQVEVSTSTESDAIDSGEKTVLVARDGEQIGEQATATSRDFVAAGAAPSANLFGAVPPKKLNRGEVPDDDSQKTEDDEADPKQEEDAPSKSKSGKVSNRFPTADNLDEKHANLAKEKNKKVARKRTAEAAVAKSAKKPGAEDGRAKPFRHRNTDDKILQLGPIAISSNVLIMCTVTCAFVGFPAFVLFGLVKNIVVENKDSPVLPAIVKNVAKEALPDLPASAIPNEIPNMQGGGLAMPGFPGVPGGQGGGQALPGMPGMPAAQGGQSMPGLPAMQGGQNAQNVKPSGVPGLSLPALPGLGGPAAQQSPNPAASIQGQPSGADLPEAMPAMPQMNASAPLQNVPATQTKVASASPPRKPDLKHLSGVWALDFKNQAGQIGRGRMVVEHKGNQIRGNGDDAFGAYQIGGTINKNHVFFRKAYIRNGRIHGNPIPYDGKLSMDKKRGFPRIDGQWKLSRREGYNTLSHVSTHSYAFRAMMLEMAPDEKELKARAAEQQAKAANQQSMQNMLDTVPINDSSVPMQQSGPQ